MGKRRNAKFHRKVLKGTGTNVLLLYRLFVVSILDSWILVTEGDEVLRWMARDALKYQSRRCVPRERRWRLCARLLTNKFAQTARNRPYVLQRKFSARCVKSQDKM